MNNPSHHFFWLASRASGSVALILLSLSVGVALAPLLGLTVVGRKRVSLTQLHEALSLTALLMIAAHGLLLLGDAYFHPSLKDLVIPGAFAYKPLWTSTGIIASYFLFTAGLAFYLRKRIQKWWRWLHRLTIVGFGLAVIHSFGSGSDNGAIWFMLLGGTLVFPATLLIASWLKKLHRKSATKRSRQPPLVVPK